VVDLRHNARLIVLFCSFAKKIPTLKLTKVGICYAYKGRRIVMMGIVKKHREGLLSDECGSVVDAARKWESVASSDILMVLDECREGENLVGPFQKVEELMVSLNSNDKR